ncbi:MAG: hypothetical protein KA954_11055 [Chitinophagales bacterium]|nr:hypothetical protein [Chitinophagales bacterium]
MKNKYRPEIDGQDVEITAPIDKDAKTRNYTLKWTNPQDDRSFEQTYIMGMENTESIDSMVEKFRKYIYSQYDSEE